MEFERLAQIYLRLESISSRLEMTDVIAVFLESISDQLLSNILLFLRGSPFPIWSSQELGISDKLMIKVISQVSGKTEDAINRQIRQLGDIGLVAEEELKNKPQTTLFSQELSVERVFDILTKLVDLTGKGSQDKKFAYISEMFSNASPTESRYLTRLILGQLRIGVGDGVIRDSIAKAYGVQPSDVERSYNLRPDWGDVALTAKHGGEAGLKDYGIVVGNPIKVMLAIKSQGLESALNDLGKVQIEIKYDGARVQIHKNGDKVELFTRRLEDVTKQFPEIVDLARKNLLPKICVVEGEIVAVEKDTGKPLAFQNLSRRIKRKYHIENIILEIPVEINLFDILYHSDQMTVDMPFEKRRELLESSVTEADGFKLAQKLVTDDLTEAQGFYQMSLAQGHEGVMLKVIDAPYHPGSRVGYMYKVKPVMESLDLVVTGATWGEGRRASWLGSYLLSVYDPPSGEYLEIGRMATGLTDEQLDEFTKMFKSLIVNTDGKEVSIIPKIIFEVAYEEIQKSPTYSSGYAMRFPRLVRIRDDKGIDEADTLRRVEDLIDGEG